MRRPCIMWPLYLQCIRKEAFGWLNQVESVYAEIEYFHRSLVKRACSDRANHNDFERDLVRIDATGIVEYRTERVVLLKHSSFIAKTCQNSDSVKHDSTLRFLPTIVTGSNRLSHRVHYIGLGERANRSGARPIEEPCQRQLRGQSNCLLLERMRTLLWLYGLLHPGISSNDACRSITTNPGSAPRLKGGWSVEWCPRN